MYDRNYQHGLSRVGRQINSVSARSHHCTSIHFSSQQDKQEGASLRDRSMVMCGGVPDSHFRLGKKPLNLNPPYPLLLNTP